MPREGSGELQQPQIDNESTNKERKPLRERVAEKAQKIRVHFDRGYAHKLEQERLIRERDARVERNHQFEVQEELAKAAYDEEGKKLTPISKVTEAGVARPFSSMEFSAEGRQAERSQPIPPRIRKFAQLATSEAYLQLGEEYPSRISSEKGLLSGSLALVGQVEVSPPILSDEAKAQKKGFYQVSFKTTHLRGEQDKAVWQTLALVQDYKIGSHVDYINTIDELNKEPRPDPVTGYPDWIVGDRHGETHVIGSNIALYNKAQEKQTNVSDMLKQQGWDVKGEIRIIDKDRYAGNRTFSGEIINAR